MSVPGRVSVAAKRASRPDGREAGVAGSWNGTDRPDAAVGRQGRYRNVPATVSVSPQVEWRWYAPHPAVEALERRLPFVDLVTWSCWLPSLRACLGVRLHRPVGRPGIFTVPQTCCGRPQSPAGSAGDGVAARRARRAGPSRLCRWRWAMPSHASRWPGQVAAGNPANLTRAVRAPSGFGSTPAWAEPRAWRKGGRVECLRRLRCRLPGWWSCPVAG